VHSKYHPEGQYGNAVDAVAWMLHWMQDLPPWSNNLMTGVDKLGYDESVNPALSASWSWYTMQGIAECRHFQ
jgi:hypothetical protein